MPRISRYVLLTKDVIGEDEWRPYTASFVAAGVGASVAGAVTSDAALTVAIIMAFALTAAYVTAFIVISSRRKVADRGDGDRGEREGRSAE